MWKKLITISLHQKDTLNCDNYKGVRLLPHCEQEAQLMLKKVTAFMKLIISKTVYFRDKVTKEH